jgi:phosphopentomutase
MNDGESPTKKIVLIVLDGVGVGELPDAGRYGDEGSNTLAHTAEAVGGLTLPNLQALGLGNIIPVRGIPAVPRPRASFGKMAEVSRGKDSTTGHWELGGIVLEGEFPTFPGRFPDELLGQFLRHTGCRGFLGNTTASGTVIIQELGEEHVRTGFPIVYTSADSVFQIAAHEEVIPLDRLYEMCRITRARVCTGSYAVGRVIARPFVGGQGVFTRTANRRDFSLEPPSDSMLDILRRAGIATTGIGKVDDLFAGRGFSHTVHTTSNAAGIAETLDAARGPRGGLVFTNLVDFDTLYGHRNDPTGFASALTEFDRSLPAFLETIAEDDLLILTADHGNDPVTPSTDHSREYVPLLCAAGSKRTGIPLGTRRTFADVGKTVVEFFGVANDLAGTPFVREVV